jgi:lysophospholipase L1-like esterase
VRNTARVTWPLVSVVLGFALALIPAASGQAQANRKWVATWMASPMAGTWAGEFHDQTVRMTVHLSIGGSRLRVEFSNAFGEHSLIIGAAHLAVQAIGAAIVPGSDRPLTFGGASSVTIPPGALYVSDPVDLNVSPLSNLAVSIYVPDRTGPATFHQTGLHTTYISSTGNFAASENMPYQWTSAFYYWVSAVDVEASEGSGAIVALGDSITDGYHSTPNANMQWPSQLAARFQANPGTAHLAVLNAGISGNRVLHDVSGPNALARLDRDAIARDGVKYLIVLESINDLGFPHAPNGIGHDQQEVTARQLIAGMQQIIERAHAHGIKVFGATLTPYQGSPAYGREEEAKREEINHWMRTSGAFDGVIDFDAAVRDRKNPLILSPDYDSGDHIHPNDAGYKAMADAVNLTLFH